MERNAAAGFTVAPVSGIDAPTGGERGIGPTGAAGPAGVLARVRLAVSDIKLAHSVFAMPFALLGAVMAAEAVPGGLGAGPLAAAIGLVVLCMVLARTWAMLVNRLADRSFDAENPRTARRVFASGRLGAGQGWLIALACAGLFVGAAGLFWPVLGNPWPLTLAVPVLGWIALYSYTKRFTALCHVFLGGALAASPLAAAIALHPQALGEQAALWLLAGMVVCWVAGFDIIYALQDLEFDRERGLKSVPARLGAIGGIRVSRLLHGAAFGLLAGAWAADPRFGWIMLLGVLLVGGLLILEHAILAKRGKAGLDMAFFTVNGVVSVVLGLCGIADVLI